MAGFAELGLGPDRIEALAAEGIETPTEFQEGAVPVIRRGNNLVGRAGPGAGTLVAWAAPLLDRLEELEEESPSETRPLAVVLVSDDEVADRIATSLARLAETSELRVAALGGTWLLPTRAEVLVASPDELLALVREARASLEGVRAVVVDQLTAVVSLRGTESLETLLDFVPGDAQRVVIDLPSRKERPASEALVEKHLSRAVHVPPRAVEEDRGSVPDRGGVAFRIVREPKEAGGLRLVAEILADPDVRHLAVFFRNEDRAADVGDHLGLHGYLAGAPGDDEVPVWLGIDALEVREALAAEGVAVLSWDVPADPDQLDRRHGGGRGGHVLLLPREVAHLRDVARRTGYDVVPSPPPAEDRIADDLVRTVEAVETALEQEDVSAYLLVLESLFEDHDPAEVAAAAVALLRSKRAEAAGGAGETAPTPQAAPPSRGTPTPTRRRGPSYVKLFVSLGSRDDAGPGDIVGAIAGETGVDAKKVGRIDLRESFSIVEVEEEVAERVIRELNGKSIRGRSVRVDYDRAAQRGRADARERSGGRR